MPPGRPNVAHDTTHRTSVVTDRQCYAHLMIRADLPPGAGRIRTDHCYPQHYEPGTPITTGPRPCRVRTAPCSRSTSIRHVANAMGTRRVRPAAGHERAPAVDSDDHTRAPGVPPSRGARAHKPPRTHRPTTA